MNPETESRDRNGAPGRGRAHRQVTAGDRPGSGRPSSPPGRRRFLGARTIENEPGRRTVVRPGPGRRYRRVTPRLRLPRAPAVSTCSIGTTASDACVHGQQRPDQASDRGAGIHRAGGLPRCALPAGRSLASSSLAWVEVSRAVLARAKTPTNAGDLIDAAMSGIDERPMTAERRQRRPPDRAAAYSAASSHPPRDGGVDRRRPRRHVRRPTGRRLPPRLPSPSASPAASNAAFVEARERCQLLTASRQDACMVVMSGRAVNRATLARQMLLEREDVSVVEAVGRLVGMQGQEPKHPYVGLWSRVDGFEEGSWIGPSGSVTVVRATLFRGTLHLVTAEDYLRFRIHHGAGARGRVEDAQGARRGAGAGEGGRRRRRSCWRRSR